jgi:uncharacterized membrane protein (GlpM family)
VEDDSVTTFVMIMIYASFVLAGLLGLSALFILFAHRVIASTHDPDAH